LLACSLPVALAFFRLFSATVFALVVGRFALEAFCLMSFGLVRVSRLEFHGFPVFINSLCRLAKRSFFA
jgi:hypothetical protein